MTKLISFNILLLVLVFASAQAAEPNAKDLKNLESKFSALLDDRVLVGAQLIVGRNNTILLERNYGVRSVTDETPVDADTRFCIGSCSKPYTSACIMALVQDNKLELDHAIDAILPQFGNLTIEDTGSSTRAPTLRELLCHRAGIYSQKMRMSRRQSKWIRDFSLTLEQSVNGIAKEKLIASPGELYAYSGAGYCVIGRLAEAATKKSFEQLMQENICAPLDLKRTTYFPQTDDANVASGSINGKPNPATPHLTRAFKLSLIGGSLYSTARDSSRFAQMIIKQARLGDRIIHTPSTFNELIKPHYKNQRYGMGWTLTVENGKTIELRHTGSLASSRAIFRINLKIGVYGIALYTISNPSASKPIGRALGRSISAVVSPH